AERVRQAADKTAAAGSARVTLNVALSGAGVSAAVTGDGVLDLDERRGALNLDLGSLGSSLGGSRSVEAVLDRGGLFVKLPALLTAAKPWLKVDLAALSAPAGINLGPLGQLKSADPAQALAFLKGAASDVKKVGTETVREASTTHYRGTMNLRDAAAALPAEASKTVDDVAAALGTTTIGADVWLDDEGRMRKMRFGVDAGGGGAGGSVEFEMYDFGVAADVRMPPAEQVTDLAAFLSGGPR
ncbi:MAG: hypothetical protein ACRD2W_23400, partial [Acidimicrobiales bacterium]